MQKYQYIRECDLPSPASAAELQYVETACALSANVSYGDSAKDWLSDTRTPECQLRGAIIRHIRDGKRVFHKFKEGSKKELIPDDVQANVTFPDGADVYVEIWLEGDGVITIYAHEHYSEIPLLPQ